MIEVIEGERVQWQDDSGGWHVGAVLRHESGEWIQPCEFVLVVEHPSGRKFMVDPDRLSPYPAAPIEEPSK